MIEESQPSVAPAASSAPVTIPYRANLLGNIEQALKGLQGYGIMALELIQNADDAGARRLTFDARDDALVVSNEGEFTSCGFGSAECSWLRSGDPEGRKRPCNFHAIAEMGSRSKVHAPDQIGRFGIGFVSVYQITDTPIVRSSGIELSLNPQTQEVSKRDIEGSPGTEFLLPWASDESEVRTGLNASPTPVDVAEKVVAEVERMLQGSLLFLRHVESVELRRNGSLVLDVRITRTEDEVSLTFEPSGTAQRWLVLTRDGDDIIAEAKLHERFERLIGLHRSPKVSVAVPLDVEEVEGLLYAYLPTRETTGMPVHVNADFFPHASRQAIVLDGEQHDRFWNEALIGTAAAALADNFVRVRDLLGATRFWALLGAAYQRRSEPAFKPFWDRLGRAANEIDSVLSTGEDWHLASDTLLPPEGMSAADQAAVATLGLALIHPELRRHWTVLSSLGAQQLRLATVAGALEELGSDAAGECGAALRRLWSAVEYMIEQNPDRQGQPLALGRLKAIPFLLDRAERPISPRDARRLPVGVSASTVSAILPDRRLVHSDVLLLPRLASLVVEYLWDELALDLAAAITDQGAAVAVIGDTDADVRRFYSLLASFPTERGASLVETRLGDTPILRAGTGFVSPSRGQLPGNFRDPIGRFEIVDTRLFVQGMMEVARALLRVDVLSFREYVEEHLEEIIEGGITRQQFGLLLTEIVNHRSQLEEDGTLEVLSRVAFLRNRAGEFVRPGEVYFWTAALASILGDEPGRWIDESWLPPELLARCRDLFDRLGTPFTVATEHIVERIAAIAAAGQSVEATVRGTTPIVRHILERWSRFDEKDRETLAGLRFQKFLAGLVDGERDERLGYSPLDVYRAGRAAGFASQVPVVEMTALRQSNAIVSDFLDLIEMPAEPPTEIIVAHLEHCMATGEPVNDLTYQMLSERLDRGDDIEAIDRLEGTDFIYVPEVGFIGAGDVFWLPPPFGGRWHTASQRMRQREALYRRLGVVDAPEPRHHAVLALEIAATSYRSAADVAIHSRCLAALAEALERDDAGASEALDLLRNESAFLAMTGDPLWTGSAVWLDSEQLAAAFDSVLDDRLVRLVDVGRSAAARFFARLDVPALSDMARFRLAQEPDDRRAEDATELLRSRADLILWLAPNRGTRQALRAILADIEIRFSDQLLVQAEIDVLDPPVRSPPTSSQAFLDPDEGTLHLRSANGKVDWAAAFRALFAEVERHCPTADVPPLCATAAYIMLHADREDAEQALLTADFKAPDDEDHGIEAGRELEDHPVDPEEEPVDVGDDEDTAQTSTGDEEASANEPDDKSEGAQEEGVALEDEEPEDLASSVAGDEEADEGPVTDALQSPDTNDGTHEAEFGDDDFDDEDYGSASSKGSFGEDETSGDAPRQGDASKDSGRSDTLSSGGGWSGDQWRGRSGSRRAGRRDAERQVRRSRMLSYVSRSSSRDSGEGTHQSADDDITVLVDAAAMKAALAYERSRGWEPEQQPHFNPGFDILSRSPTGGRRLIEVKGLESEWTERGVKLSHVQFSMAREHPDEFWIYVVEHARDRDRQRVTAIGNPFSKVEEYWFDHNWRAASDERVASRDIHLKVGLAVEHDHWGKGVVVEIKSRGVIPFVVIDFGVDVGRRGIPFNSTLRIRD